MRASAQNWRIQASRRHSSRRGFACKFDGGSANHRADCRAVAHVQQHATLEVQISLNHRPRAYHDPRRVAGVPLEEPKDLSALLFDQNPAFDTGITADVNVAAYGFNAAADVRALQKDLPIHIRER